MKKNARGRGVGKKLMANSREEARGQREKKLNNQAQREVETGRGNGRKGEFLMEGKQNLE